MSVEASSFVTRHVRGITTAQRAVLGIMADLCNAAGRTRATLATVAEVVELSRRQVERHARALRQAGVIERDGRTWIVCGVAEHDLRTCTHPWCVKQHQRACRPKTTRPRARVADPAVWAQLSAAPPLGTAMYDAATRVRPRAVRGAPAARPP